MLTPISFTPQELRLIFPNSQRLNRGNYVMSQLIQACRANEVTDLILVHEHRGEPGMPWKVFSFLLQNVSNSFDAGPVKVKINIFSFLSAHSLELANE